MLPGRLQAIEATDPRRVSASRTSNGHFLVLNSVFPPERKRHKIRDISKSGMTWHARFFVACLNSLDY